MFRIQANRKAAVMTPLGDDALALKAFTVTEELGRPFRLELELVSDDHSIKFEDILGQNVTVRLTLRDGQTRFFNGFVNRFAQVPSLGEQACYRAEVAPWLWFLTRVADCRIFQDKTAPDIVQQVFRDLGFTDFKVSLTANYRTREYCVQYRETDFNFVSRLLEEEGIYYFFEHENGKHTMVLADSKSAHATYPGYETFPHRFQDQATVEEDCVYDWVVEQEVQPGIVSLNDFDFEKPNKALTVKANISRPHAVPNFEVFDYPGAYVEFSDGEAYARKRVEELQVRHEQARAQTRSKGLVAGCLFKLERHTRDDQNREYLAISSRTKVVAELAPATAGTPPELFVQCEFRALASDAPYRAARLTPHPTVKGPQTAMVVGPTGEEIYTDKYGRVKVRFHWDHRGQGDENSSCWLRVAQSTAGKTWGGIQLPRVGQEVIVDFLEGDPDRPIVVGRVYNGEAMPPYALPDNKTISTLKSNSTKGGKGFNEIRFEDKKGDEQVFIHAERNLDQRVKRSAYESVGSDRHLTVGNDQVEQVGRDRQETLARDHVQSIGRDRHLAVGGKEAVAIGGSVSLAVGENVTEEIGKNQSTKVAQDFYLKAKNIVLEAEENITIHVGESYIAIEKTGIKIATTGEIVLDAKKDITQKAAMNLKLEGGVTASVAGKASLKLESSAQAELKSPMTTVKGDGMLTVKGGMVMIN